MPALTNITGLNGEATPVAYTFAPIGPDAQGVQWFEQITPAPANGLAAARVSVSMKRSGARLNAGESLRSVARIEVALWIPTMETLSNNDSGIIPPPTIAYTCQARIVYMVPERATAQERKNLRALLASVVFAGTPLAALVETLQAMY